MAGAAMLSAPTEIPRFRCSNRRGWPPRPRRGAPCRRLAVPWPRQAGFPAAVSEDVGSPASSDRNPGGTSTSCRSPLAAASVMGLAFSDMAFLGPFVIPGGGSLPARTARRAVPHRSRGATEFPRVFAQSWRRRPQCAGSPRQPRHDVVHQDVADLRIGHVHDHFPFNHVRVRKQLVLFVHRCRGSPPPLRRSPSHPRNPGRR